MEDVLKEQEPFKATQRFSIICEPNQCLRVAELVLTLNTFCTVKWFSITIVIINNIKYSETETNIPSVLLQTASIYITSKWIADALGSLQKHSGIVVKKRIPKIIMGFILQHQRMKMEKEWRKCINYCPQCRYINYQDSVKTQKKSR